MIVCKHCEEEAFWNAFFEDWYCGACRMRDTKEIEEDQNEVRGL